MNDQPEFAEAFFAKHSYHSIAIKLLQNNQIVDIPLTGHCMKPLLRETDIITVKPVKVENLSCGDIVLYHINGRLKCHRFLRFNNYDDKQYLITKSDRRHTCDPPVPSSNLLGKVVHVERNGKKIDYETTKWTRINFVLGKISPIISNIERPAVLLYRIPRKAASIIRRAVMAL
ncbi:hypothetical protein HGB13_04250 [bacterium]|nr:hypothetical protein [bacterium]